MKYEQSFGVSHTNNKSQNLFTFLVTLKKYPSCAFDSNFKTFLGSIPKSLAAIASVLSISDSMSSNLSLKAN